MSLSFVEVIRVVIVAIFTLIFFLAGRPCGVLAAVESVPAEKRFFYEEKVKFEIEN